MSIPYIDHGLTYAIRTLYIHMFYTDTTIPFIEHIKHNPYLTLVLTLNMFSSARREDDDVVHDDETRHAWPDIQLNLLKWRELSPAKANLILLMPTATVSTSLLESVGSCREKQCQGQVENKLCN